MTRSSSKTVTVSGKRRAAVAPSTSVADGPLETVRGAEFWLAPVFLLVGVLVLAFALTLAYYYYTPIPIFDHWAFYMMLLDHNGEYPWSELFAQHNEHRPLVLRLLGLMDLGAAHGSNLVFWGAIFLGQLAHAGLLVAAARRWGGMHGRALLLWTGLMLAYFFNPSQRENFTWAWQACFIVNLLSGTAAIGALLLHAEQWRKPGEGAGGRAWSTAFWAALLLPVVAWLSLISGLLVWVLLAALAWWLRLPRSNAVALAAGTVVASGLQFWHYTPVAHHINPVVALGTYTGRFVLFIFSYLGGMVDLGPAIVAELFGAAGLCAWGYFLWRAWQERQQQLGPEQGPPLFRSGLLGLMTLVVMTAALTSMGRLAVVGDQHAVNRYQSVALLFWVGLIGLVWERLPLRLGRGVLLRWPAVATIALLLALTPFLDTGATWATAVEQQRLYALANLSVASNVDDLSRLKIPLPLGDWWHRWREYTRQTDRGVFAYPLYRLWQEPVNRLYRPAQLRTCLGFVDGKAQRVVGRGGEGLLLTGWAWNPWAKKPVRELVAVDEQNRIVGFAQTVQVRVEVPRFVPEVTDARVGFEGYVPAAMAGRAVQLYGVDEQELTCQVGNPVTLAAAQ